MELISPSGGVYNAGTFNGNPLSMAAGIATNAYLHENEGLYAKLDEKTRAIEESLPANASGSFVRLGSLFKYFFRSTAPRNYLEAKQSDTAAFRVFFEKALKDGVFIPPSQFETNFLSTAHDASPMEKIISVYQHV
jgi:glutamate-1-semialdehyde 2,1-aminomutase